MPKTLPPGVVELAAGATFQANVVPDVFDGRDLEYRPRLAPLPATQDVRPAERFVMTQVGNSCTGHAVASMINTVLSTDREPVHVSPYMLYRMARRYDEFEGDEDEGSSLRGVLKGWYYHGVLPVEDWAELDPDREPDLDDNLELATKAEQCPLGAFYRVNALRLDDMQSAVLELNGIVASAAVHSGWLEPTPMVHKGSTLHVIERPVDAEQIGGHAFSIVGYNQVGFLVQNSWGEEWGAGGFATLPYDDWLQSAYDAWVARPGVPSIVFERDRTQMVSATRGGFAVGRGPDLPRLARHVVNLGNEGQLSANGRFRSTPTQVHKIFQRADEYHRFWRDAARREGRTPPTRRIVMYAHGGLNSESTGLGIAHSQLSWWLNNEVYPITFAWQTGAIESLLDHLVDAVRDKLPFGFLGIDLVEQADRFVERRARSHFRWMWDEMKENAAAASAPLLDAVDWPADDAAVRGLPPMPGASLTVNRLHRYLESVPADEQVEVHLVGHSAGSIFLAAMLDRLAAEGVPVTSMAFLAPALRVDEFERRVLPHLRRGHVQRFTSFGLTEQRELDDICGTGGLKVYQKSLLYLVSRALERRGPGVGREADVPLLGMQRHARTRLERPGDDAEQTVADVLTALGAELVWSPTERPAASRSTSRSHHGFDNDEATMTSVLLRILGLVAPTARTQFQAHAPLLNPGLESRPRPERDGSPDATRVVESAPAGTAPVTVTAGPQPAGVAVPPAEDGSVPEEVVAPLATSPIVAAMERGGWHREDEA